MRFRTTIDNVAPLVDSAVPERRFIGLDFDFRLRFAELEGLLFFARRPTLLDSYDIALRIVVVITIVVGPDREPRCRPVQSASDNRSVNRRFLPNVIVIIYRNSGRQKKKKNGNACLETRIRCPEGGGGQDVTTDRNALSYSTGSVVTTQMSS
jgi:hypothetical protein